MRGDGREPAGCGVQLSLLRDRLAVAAINKQLGPCSVGVHADRSFGRGAAPHKVDRYADGQDEQR